MPKSLVVSLLGVSLLMTGCAERGAVEAPVGGAAGPVSDRVAGPAAGPPAPTLGPLRIRESALPSRRQGPIPRHVLEVDADAPVEMDGVVRCILQDSRGRLWVGGEGLYCFDGASATSYLLTDDNGRGVTIKEMVESADGSIWCGTTGGLSRIDGELFASYGEVDGLLSHDVWSLALDAGGKLWIGTIDGVCHYDGATFTQFHLPEAEPDPTRGVTSGAIVHCIEVDLDGRMWFGTNGGAYIYDGATLSGLSEADGLPNDAVNRILADRAGNMWFGTTHGGISRYDGEDFTNFTERGDVVGQEIWSLHEDRAGNIWFSGKRFGVYRYDGAAFVNFTEADGVASPGLMSITDDDRGWVWLGGVNGLFRRKGDGFVQVHRNGPWE